MSFLILMSLFNNCNKNDFLDTELKLETDKKSYYINEKIELKIIVSTNENKKKIRFEKDFNNIDINFNTPEIQNSFHQVLKQKFIEFPSSSEKKKIDIPENFIITINSVALSTTRGLMFSLFKGTFLQGAILPLLDPSQYKKERK